MTAPAAVKQCIHLAAGVKTPWVKRDDGSEVCIDCVADSPELSREARYAWVVAMVARRRAREARR